MNLYDEIGGEETFLRLTDAFYDRVAGDPLLRPLFPPNMAPGKRRLALFMAESLGGPAARVELRAFVIEGADLALNHRPRRPVRVTVPE